MCAYLKQHGSLIEKHEMHEGLLKALHCLLLISEVDEVEIFKICLEYWNSLAADLYHECPFNQTHSSSLFMSRPTGSNAGGKLACSIDYYFKCVNPPLFHRLLF